MTTQPSKTSILDLLQRGHLDEEAFVQELNEQERNAIGTSDHWSVKDHLAHLTFWHQALIQRVTAVLQQQELPPGEEDEQELNEKVFEQHRSRSWSDVRAESERAYAQLIALLEQLSEEDLTRSERFSSITGGVPLYTFFLGGCYEHDIALTPEARERAKSDPDLVVLRASGQG